MYYSIIYGVFYSYIHLIALPCIAVSQKSELFFNEECDKLRQKVINISAPQRNASMDRPFVGPKSVLSKISS